MTKMRCNIDEGRYENVRLAANNSGTRKNNKLTRNDVGDSFGRVTDFVEEDEDQGTVQTEVGNLKRRVP